MSEQSEQMATSLVPVGRRQVMVLLEAGYVWMDLQQFDKAKEVFAGTAALVPKSEVPQLALGTLEFVQGRHDKALQAYRAAQRLAPRSALPRAHAAEALLFMGKASEALKEIKAALELEPESDGARFAQALLEAKEAGALPPSKKEG
jgi:tetratricopeptide (TPR) repeat protein